MDQQLERRASGEIQSAALQVSAGFGQQGAVMRGETASQAIAAREAAAVQSRYVMAERNPRDIEQFRVKLLEHCKRLGFATAAWYSKPVGGSKPAQGFTIRFCEAALQCYRNVYPEVSTVFDGPDLRIVRVSVTDLEANLAYSTEIGIEKTVERKSAKGREILSQRENSYGETTYTVKATEDELMIRQAALVSKAIRTNGLRLLPPDILEEAAAAVAKSIRDQISKDPAAAKRALIDAFAEQGVTPVDLAVFLGHSIEQVTVKEMTELRSVYSSLKSGEASWSQIMEAADTTPDPALAEEVRNRIKAEADAKKAAKTEAPAEPSEEEMRRLDAEALAREAAAEQQPLMIVKGFRK